MKDGRELPSRRQQVLRLFSIIFFVCSGPVLISLIVQFWPETAVAAKSVKVPLMQIISVPIAILSGIASVAFLIVISCQIGIWTDWFATGRKMGDSRPAIPIIFLAVASALGVALFLPMQPVEITVDLPPPQVLPKK
jgi:hypothetical protein